MILLSLIVCNPGDVTPADLLLLSLPVPEETCVRWILKVACPDM